MQLLLDCHNRSLLFDADAIAEQRMVVRVMATEDGHGGPDTRRSSGRALDRPWAAEACIGTSVHLGISPAARQVAGGGSGSLSTAPDGTGPDAVPERSPVSDGRQAGDRRRVDELAPRPGGPWVILG